MNKKSKLYVFERTENFDALLVYCREILRFSNKLTEEVINLVIDRVINSAVMSKSIDLELLSASPLLDPDTEDPHVTLLRCNPKYQRVLLKYMNLFAQDFFDKVLALGVRQQYSSSHKKERSIFIYKGLIHQNQFAVMEIN